MKKILIVVLVLMIALTTILGMTACKDKNTIIVGIDPTFAPMGFQNEKGEIVGFDIDLAREVGKKLNKKIKFQPINWQNKEVELNSKAIDLIWNGYTISPERKEKVTFSAPYLKNIQVIIKNGVVPEGFKVEDLNGKKIGAQGGSTAVEVLKSIKTTFSVDFSIEEVKDNDIMLNELKSGAIDFAILDEILFDYKKKNNSAYSDMNKVLNENEEIKKLSYEEYGVGMRKEDKAMQEALSKALKELYQEKKVEEIAKKWGLEGAILPLE